MSREVGWVLKRRTGRVTKGEAQRIRERFANPYVAADRGFVDAASSRARLARN